MHSRSIKDLVYTSEYVAWTARERRRAGWIGCPKALPSQSDNSVGTAINKLLLGHSGILPVRGVVML